MQKKDYVAAVVAAYIRGEENAYEHYQELGHEPVRNDVYNETDLEFVARMAEQDFDDGEDNLVYPDLLPKVPKVAKIRNHGLFHTPESMAEIEAWIQRHNSEDRIHLYTAMMMFNNLLATHDSVEIIREDK